MATSRDFGGCWCHARHGMHIPADSDNRLCSACRGRSPSACERAHKREVADRADVTIKER